MLQRHSSPFQGEFFCLLVRDPIADLLRVSPAEDALRTSLLAIGAVHLRYSGATKDALGAWKVTYQARSQVWSFVKRTKVWEGGPRDMAEEEELDVVLAALLGCTIASVSSATLSTQYLIERPSSYSRAWLPMTSGTSTSCPSSPSSTDSADPPLYFKTSAEIACPSAASASNSSQLARSLAACRRIRRRAS